MTSETYERTFEHPGNGADDLRIKVRDAEREAEKELGGAVERSHRFISDNKCTFTWRRKQ